MDIFSSLAIILGLAAVCGVLAKVFKQPAIVGYILSGILISSLGFFKIGQSQELVGVLGKIGVTLLLFLVGLELPLNELKRLGQTALFTGVSQIIITASLGFVLAHLLGFSVVHAMYIGLALTFGSTVVVVNLLSVKKDLQSLYGRLTVGYLLVEDFVAIGILVLLSGLSGGGDQWSGLLWVVVKGALLIGGAAWISDRFLPKILDWLGRSSEILFIVSLGWCLLVASFVSSTWVGFSVELGGFLAGLALASAAENLQIIARVRPLRDFFMVLFFVALGSSISLAQLGTVWLPGLILSVFVLVGNPLILMLILSWQGFNRRVSFLTGVTVAQVSEFSLIILALAQKIGHVDNRVLSLVALITLITMLLSTYLITYADRLYKVLSPYLFMFKKTNQNAPKLESKTWENHAVLFGHNRVGNLLRPALEKLKLMTVVVDFDPRVLELLKTNPKVTAIYGDIADFDLYEELNLAGAKLVISTVSDVNDNLQLLKYLKKIKTARPSSVVLATDNHDALLLYKSGADLVIVPHSVGGEYLAHFLKERGFARSVLAHWGKLHLQKLNHE